MKWNGVSLTTLYISSTQLKAAVPAADLAVAGTASVKVVSLSPGGTSNALAFTIKNPTPVVTALSPTSIEAGSLAFTLTVTGPKFVQGAVVCLNATALTTTFVSSTELKASVPAGKFASAATLPVTVLNPALSAGRSNALNFTVTP